MSGEVGPAKRCAACGELSDKWNEPLYGLKIKRRKYDLSSTYDGVTIASERFLSLYQESGFTGLRFRRLPDDPAFHDIYPIREVQVDQGRSLLRLKRWCPVCSRYGCALGPRVEFAPDTVVEDREFARSDLEFADGDEKYPLFLVGRDIPNVLKTSKMKGFSISKKTD